MSSTLLPSNNSTPVSTVQPNSSTSDATRQNPAPLNPSASQTAFLERLWSKRTTTIGRTVTALTLLCTILGLWAAFSGTGEGKGANTLAGKANLLSQWTANLTFYEFCESVSLKLHPTCWEFEPSRHKLIFRRRVGIVQAATRRRTAPLGRRQPSFGMSCNREWEFALPTSSFDGLVLYINCSGHARPTATKAFGTSLPFPDTRAPWVLSPGTETPRKHQQTDPELHSIRLLRSTLHLIAHPTLQQFGKPCSHPLQKNCSIIVQLVRPFWASIPISWFLMPGISLSSDGKNLG